MTGYGRGDGEFRDGNKLTVEIKGVNHRFLEIFTRLPRGWTAVDNLIKERIKSRVSRGKADLFVTISSDLGTVVTPHISHELARQYLKLAQELAEELEVPCTLNVVDIVKMPEVLSIPQDIPEAEDIWQYLLPPLDRAIDEFVIAREKEGHTLAKDIYARNEQLKSTIFEVEKMREGAASDLAERMHARLTELLKEVEVDQTRIVQEAAFMADKEDITEELIRLRCHLERFTKSLKKPPPIGKELDFLLQEMLRETNTCCSKVSDVVIIHKLVTAKNDIEKMREQVQNLE